MAGYAFAKYSFRGKNFLFGILIASMLVPAEVNIPSMYIFFSQIGWLDSYQVQIFPGTASVLGMFMARQFMSGLPNEVLEAAKVDGAGHWRTFWQIALPMSAPMLGAIAVLTFVAKWSDYLWPRIMVGNPAFQPIMVLLPELSTGQDSFIVHYEILLAGALVITLPLLFVFLRFQDQLMSGTTAGAVRG
jgi:ABC-type glycerol-3-phosphate transport system permease component